MKEIPKLGFGTWPLRGAEALDAIAVAFETGFRHLDTAQLYDNEHGAVDRLVECANMELAGKVGVSNFTPSMLERAAGRAAGKLVTNQVEYHPLIDQRPLERVARDSGMKLTAYGALARGECLKLPTILTIARRRGVGAAEVILSWALAQDVYALTRSNKPDHIRASWKAQDLKLSPDELAEISALREGNRRFIAPANLLPGWDF